MAHVVKLVPVSDLRKDAASVLRKMRNSREPVVITQRGRAAAVLLSIQAYEESQQARELLQLLAAGENEIAKGKGHSLDSVFREANSLFERGGS